MSSLFELPDLPETAPAAGRPVLRAVPDVPPLDFDAAVRELAPRLQRYATRRLGDRHEAEELVQEALLRAYDHRGGLATEDDLAAWSTCVTGRLVIDRLRVRGRSTSVAEVPEGSRVGRDTADVVVARDEARTALDALDAMPPRQAAVLWAREVEGLAYDEIGERFGMTEPAVRSVLSRARKALRREFAVRGGTLPAAGLVALAPWVDGLTWADRLRRVAVRTAAPAALGVLGLGLLTGAFSAPWSAPVEADPSLLRPVVVAQGSAPAVGGDAASARAATPDAAVRTRSAADARAAVAPATGGGLPGLLPVRDALVDSGLNDTCATTEEQGVSATTPAGDVDAEAPDGAAGAVAGGGAGGAGCGSPGASHLQVGPDLPTNPTGIHGVGVESEAVDCTALSHVPLTTCTPAGGAVR